ncbi:hypothetical protein GCM10012275_15060 [Longimycelium tulufanense]|uniref:Uncharacterized protein n=1 Tax=Longimycelium tulufanense TaxID=907463 RepID=A0A8J3CBY1_9PSEU|nr:hypothetical protein [Longimycelium tulufanense]GGM45007.1 hypothetical protein GCM10012275_15060 [Longimycelium tulufanense]
MGQQLSFFSAEAREPRLADLAGLLCGPGQAVSFGKGSAARVSAVVDEPWRAHALLAACAERDVAAEIAVSDEGRPLVRSAFRADLASLAAQWLRGAVKAVPTGFAPDGAILRLWALTAGSGVDGGYLLGLDPHAPDTHEPLATALARAGLPATRLGPRGGGPGLRIAGRRRLSRLAELLGPPPTAVPVPHWPAG